MSGDQEQLCVVDSDTGQILYYFNSSTGEMNWVNQPPKEISDQTNKEKPSSPSESSFSDPEETSDPESTKAQASAPSSPKVDAKECANLVSGEVVTVILEPCPENSKKGRTGSSKMKVNKRSDGANGSSYATGSPRKRKLEDVDLPLIPSKVPAVQQEVQRVNPFICKYCKASFPSKVLLSKHMKEHLGPKPYKCPRCYKRFRNPQNLATHVSVHVLSKPYVCIKCDKAFSSASCLTIHMSNHDRLPPYTCHHCSMTFTHSTALTIHLSTHLPQHPCLCGYCQLECANPKELSKHLKTHRVKTATKKTRLSCQVCSESFPDQKALAVHQLAKHEHSQNSNRSVNPLRQLQALIFKETPTYEANRVNQMRHMYPYSREMFMSGAYPNGGTHMEVPRSTSNSTRNSTDHPETSRSDPGDSQAKKKDPLSQLHALTYRRDGPSVTSLPQSTGHTRPMFYSSAYTHSPHPPTLLPHIKQEHDADNSQERGEGFPSMAHQGEDDSSLGGEEKMLPCLDCDKVFTNSVDLALHARVHTKNELIQCTQCDRHFVRESEFRKHLASHEDKGGSYVCPKCGKTFVHSHGLNLHLRVHSGIKPFQCKHCQKCFSHSGNLTVHIRTHTGEKPFKCQYCDSAFNHSSNLKNHMRLHTGETPYKCRYCDRSFSRSSHLRNHLIYHTLGQKEPDVYSCEVCDKPFEDIKQLNEHVKIHNESKPHVCRFCGKAFAVPSGLAVHERTHTGLKPFKCQYCSRAFNHSSNLKVHIRTHTGERPYHCKVCDTTFARSSDLRRHVYLQGCAKLAQAGSDIPPSSSQSSVPNIPLEDSNQSSATEESVPSGEPMMPVPASLQGMPVRSYPATVTYASYMGSSYKESSQETNATQDTNHFQRIKDHIKALSGATSSAMENAYDEDTDDESVPVSESHGSSASASYHSPSLKGDVQTTSENNSDGHGTITTTAARSEAQSKSGQPPPFLLSTLSLKPASTSTAPLKNETSKEKEVKAHEGKQPSDDETKDNSQQDTRPVESTDRLSNAGQQQRNNHGHIEPPSEIGNTQSTASKTVESSYLERSSEHLPSEVRNERTNDPERPPGAFPSQGPSTAIGDKPSGYMPPSTVSRNVPPGSMTSSSSSKPHDSYGKTTSQIPYPKERAYGNKTPQVDASGTYPIMTEGFRSGQPSLPMAHTKFYASQSPYTMGEMVAFSRPPVLEVEVESTPPEDTKPTFGSQPGRRAYTMQGVPVPPMYHPPHSGQKAVWPTQQGPVPLGMGYNSKQSSTQPVPNTKPPVGDSKNSDSDELIGNDTIIETSSLQPLQALTESILPKFN